MIRLFAVSLIFSGHMMAAEIVEEQVDHAGASFRIVRLAPERVQTEFAKRMEPVKFFMSAGIFEAGGIPSGLHVESAKCLHPLHLADAPGNFFLKPNGVFRIEAAGARREAFIVTE